MLRRMSSRELSEWIAFYGLEPFGADAQYLGHAITSTTIANVNRSKKQKPAKVSDFMPKIKPPGQAEDNTAKMLMMAEMFTVANGGEDLREDNDG